MVSYLLFLPPPVRQQYSKIETNLASLNKDDTLYRVTCKLQTTHTLEGC